MGPFILVDMLGLDTVLHVAEHLRESYGDSFYVHEGMQKLVADGKLGAKSGGDGFYKDGEPQLEGDGEADAEKLAELWTLKALVEACLVLEEGVCTAREIDFGMMAGAGLDPRRGLFPPFMKADADRPRRRAREARGGRRGARRALRRRRSSCGGSSPRAASGRRAGRASTPTRSPTRASRPTRSSWRPAATSRSPGSPTRR